MNEILTCHCGCEEWRVYGTYCRCVNCGEEITLVKRIDILNRELEQMGIEKDNKDK